MRYRVGAARRRLPAVHGFLCRSGRCQRMHAKDLVRQSRTLLRAGPALFGGLSARGQVSYLRALPAAVWRRNRNTLDGYGKDMAPHQHDARNAARGVAHCRRLQLDDGSRRNDQHGRDDVVRLRHRLHRDHATSQRYRRSRHCGEHRRRPDRLCVRGVIRPGNRAAFTRCRRLAAAPSRTSMAQGERRLTAVRDLRRQRQEPNG